MDLSIIIVNYNTKELLNKCLQALNKDIKTIEKELHSEIIVVDNNSTDNSRELVRDKFPKVKLVENNSNLGYAKANNIGIKKAKGKLLLLLNSDTQITKDSISILVKSMIYDKSLGVVGGKLLNFDGSTQQSAGYTPHLSKIFFWMTFLDDIFFLQQFLKPYHITNQLFYNKLNYVDWVSGACFLVRKDIIRDVGQIDEKIFMYGEEVEWCYRIKRAGYKILYTPKAIIYHHKGASAEKNVENAGIVEEFNSLLYFFKMHKSYWQKIVLKILLIYGALLRIILFAIIRRYNFRVSTYVKAIRMVR
jgi:GT2 family glycosyltransferase